MQFLLVIVFISAAVSVDAVCKSKNYTATTVSTFIENLNYDNNDDCVFNIKPGNGSQHYLEITMHQFGIRGKMPDCKEDYLEIFITR